MSRKRVAENNLNHENWDKEEPSDKEEMGTFNVASEEKLEQRTFRTAKRRIQSGDASKKGVFSEFGGFNKPPVTSFDFLANLTNGSNTTNGGTKSDTAVTSSLFSSQKTSTPSGGLFGTSSSSTFGTTAQNTSLFPSTTTKTVTIKEIPSMIFSSSKADSTVGDSPFKMHSVSSSADSNTKPSSTQVTSTIFGVSSTSPNQKSPLTNTMFKQPVSSTSTAVQNSAPIATQPSIQEATGDNESELEKAKNKYFCKLNGLNQSVSKWIVKHVEKTPLCFLTPIFKDYENHLRDIREEYFAAKVASGRQASEGTSDVNPTLDSQSSGTSLFSNKSALKEDSTPSTQAFGINPTTSEKTTADTGLFGQNSAASKSLTPSKSPPPSTKGFAFGVTSTPSATNTTNVNTGASSNPLLAPNKSPPPPTKGFSFGVTSTPSATNTTNVSTGTSSIQGFTFGMKAPPILGNSVLPPSKGFSFGATPASNTSSAFASTNTNASSPPSKGFSFGMTSPINTPSFMATGAANTGSSPTQSSPFGMSAPPTTSPTNQSPVSAFSAAPFSFGIGSGTPFSFGSQIQQRQTTETMNEAEEDQPPKVEFTAVVEENSVYEKKVKIFFKKDGNFVDKGIGTLYVKKIEESGKYQLLVRANTNLGTVLLNLILATAVPTQRMGKNNVMLVCIPTPDAQPPPTPVLIRVKTGEEADELLETLNKCKS